MNDKKTKFDFINSVKPNCGVFQYGLRLSNILKKGGLDFNYLECDSFEDFSTKKHSGIIIFNYISAGRPNAPIGWLTQNIIDQLRDDSITVGAIGHLENVKYDFDFVIRQDPARAEDQKNFSLPRPLFYDEANSPFKSSSVRNIQDIRNNTLVGSFGLGNKSKNLPDLIRLTNEQIFKGIIRLNLNSSYYSDPQGKILSEIIKECYSVKLKETVELEITNEFLDDNEIISFLNKNDINIFNYENQADDGGISSSLDYAISAMKPFAVSSSPMFKHVSNAHNLNNGIFNIIENNIKHNDYPKIWSHKNLIKKFLSILESVS